MFDHLLSVLNEIKAERERQDAKWGEQNHPNGTGGPTKAQRIELANLAKLACDTAAKQGKLTWNHILTEEMMEAIAEDDAALLRAELVQVAAVTVSWIQAIDRKSFKDASEAEEIGG